MNLLNRIRDCFRPAQDSAPPVLRNKAGGMAYVAGITQLPLLNGRIVKTVRLETAQKWEIEPSQHFTNLPAGLVYTNGLSTRGGEDGIVTAISDDCLVPLGDPGDDATDEMVAKLGPAQKAREREALAQLEEHYARFGEMRP